MEGGSGGVVVVGVLVVGVVGGSKIVSQVYLHLSFFICVHLQNISTIIVFNTQKKLAPSISRERPKKGMIAPFITSVR